MTGLNDDRNVSLSGRAGLFAVCALFLLGCDSKPRAPALMDDPVYQNDREGFRFLVPDGWKQHARADVPPGKTEKERILVQYRRPAEGGEATLEATLADLPATTDLAAFVAGPAFGVEKWRRTSPIETLDVKGTSAVRVTLSGRPGNAEMLKEVVAFRRGERVYFFTGIFNAKDGTSREQVRKAVDSIIWKD